MDFVGTQTFLLKLEKKRKWNFSSSFVFIWTRKIYFKKSWYFTVDLSHTRYNTLFGTSVWLNWDFFLLGNSSLYEAKLKPLWERKIKRLMTCRSQRRMVFLWKLNRYFPVLARRNGNIDSVTVRKPRVALLYISFPKIHFINCSSDTHLQNLF